MDPKYTFRPVYAVGAILLSQALLLLGSDPTWQYASY